MTTERLEMAQIGPPFFKCCKCGGEELDVIRQFVRSTFREATLPCDCGKADVAAMRRERDDELLEQIPAKDVAQLLGCSLAEAENLIVSGRLAKHPKSRDVATDGFALERYKEGVR